MVKYVPDLGFSSQISIKSPEILPWKEAQPSITTLNMNMSVDIIPQFYANAKSVKLKEKSASLVQRKTLFLQLRGVYITQSDFWTLLVKS